MRVKVSVGTYKVGSTTSSVIEVDDEDVEDCTEEQRNEIIDEIAREKMFDLIAWDWEIVE